MLKTTQQVKSCSTEGKRHRKGFKRSHATSVCGTQCCFRSLTPLGNPEGGAETPSQVLQTAPGVQTRWSPDDYHCDYGGEDNSGSTSGLYYGSMGSELWVANIGEGVEVLLGMNFMYSVGVRLCTREALVKLPDEETVLLPGRTADHMGRGLDLAITQKTCLYVGPGESAVVRIDYGQSNPQREVVWAGRGEHWVTQILYAVKPWPVTVKVVNISDKTVWIDSRTAIACWLAQVPMVQLQPRPNVEEVKSLAKTDVQLSEVEISGASDSEGTESREAKLIEETGGSHEDFESSGEILEDRDPVIVLEEDSESDGEAFYDAISFDGDDGAKIPRKPSRQNLRLGRARVDFCSQSDEWKMSMSGACR
ncbi:unnamed protein product [Phytophthora fragariaefolia]|uniref:Unnamed protein product n=1 Tax=Phytophthora fragariaefolia TaxID=1490495 RepID=A0A9W6XBA8_9STRA|nr:unnamed protein product [Phytophthora fragariaefolia]